MLMQHTSESLIIEEFRVSKGREFNTVHEEQLDH